MAIKRMLNKNVTESDRFINLSVKSQALYFHMNLKADDEGFVGSGKQMIRMLDLKREHINELVENEFLIAFESGIYLIRHWHIHNSIRKDRLTETIYIEEKEQVQIDSRKIYVEKATEKADEDARRIDDGQMSAQNREGENREDETRTEKPRQARPASVCSKRLDEMLKGKSTLPRAQTISALGKYMKQMDFECIEYAIEQSRQWNKQSVGYVCAILDRLLSQGVKTKDQLASQVKARHGPSKSRANKGIIAHKKGAGYYDKILERAEEL